MTQDEAATLRPYDRPAGVTTNAERHADPIRHPSPLGGDGAFTLLYSTFKARTVVSALLIARKNLVHRALGADGSRTPGLTAG